MKNWFAQKEFTCSQCGHHFIQPLALEPTERDLQLYAQAKAIETEKVYEMVSRVLKEWDFGNAIANEIEIEKRKL